MDISLFVAKAGSKPGKMFSETLNSIPFALAVGGLCGFRNLQGFRDCRGSGLSRLTALEFEGYVLKAVVCEGLGAETWLRGF